MLGKGWERVQGIQALSTCFFGHKLCRIMPKDMKDPRKLRYRVPTCQLAFSPGLSANILTVCQVLG